MAFVLGESLNGLTKVFIATFIVLIMGFCFGARPHLGFFFFLGIILNGLAFSFLAVALAMIVKSHADQSLLTSFIITPMAFLGGTFFPLDNLPAWAKYILTLLPLSHASKVIRADAFGESVSYASLLVLLIAAIIFLILAVSAVKKARD
jgi:ABC-type multidrug transport system permease subunit